MKSHPPPPPFTNTRRELAEIIAGAREGRRAAHGIRDDIADEFARIEREALAMLMRTEITRG